MRLHRLELQAFGPYPGHVTVDFDALSAGGLFLLHGDTGVGKTTVLDAIAFALYGTVPGARGQVKRLRCDSAAADVPTEVTLELSVADRRVVVVRRPEYQRPRARGTGLTTEKAHVSLHHPTDPGRPGLSRHREVGDAVLELIGMSAEQFFQVVLLPQGEFARFLRADTADRETVLERLFETERFARVEEIVAAMRRTSAAEVARLERAHGEAVARWQEASAPDEDADDTGSGGLTPATDGDAAAARPPSLTSSVDTSPALGELRERAALRAEHAAVTRAVRDAADDELADALRLADLVARRRALTAEQCALQQDTPRVDALRETLQLAERALPLRTLADEVDVRRTALERATAAAERARGAVEGLVGGPVDGSVDGSTDGGPDDAVGPRPEPHRVRRLAAADRETAGALAALVADAARLDADRRQLLDLQDEEIAVADELTTVEAEVTRSTELLAALDQQRQECETAAAMLPVLQAEEATARGVVEAAAALPSARTALVTAGDRLRDAVDSHQRARERRQELVERRIAGMAAELADGLHPGEPCPVCGSAAHPAPATPGPRRVASDEVAAAEQQESTAAAARLRAQQQRDAAQQELHRLEELSGGVELARAHQVAGAATAAVRAARLRADELPRITDRVRLLAKTLESGRVRTRELVTRRATLAGEIPVKLEQIAARRSRVEQAADGHRSVRDRRDHLLALAAAREEWADRLVERDAAEQAHDEAASALRTALAGAGFRDLAEVRAAAGVDVAAARIAVRRHEDAVVTVARRLEDPAFDGIPAGAGPDVDGARVRAARAAAAAERAVARSERAAAQLTASLRAARALAELVTRAAPVLLDDAEIGALADTVAGRGQNHRGVSLRTFVLQTRLRQVAAVASQRLSRMSSGRYSFLLAEGREGRRSGGLGLDILDAHTGVARPAKTLSGGESFLASLALALGLADVVAGESGGRVLDTIFIDEGFGTLDADALELVMGTLDELRSGGRIVGLVSHVDDLQQRIPTRLHVRRGPGGPQPVVVGG